MVVLLGSYPAMSYQEENEEIIEVKDSQIPGAREWLQYESVKKGRVNTEVGCHYIVKDGAIKIEVSTISTGRGADYRKWEVTDTKIIIDGNIIRPDKFNKFYVRKESLFRWPAVVVFAVFGAMYENYAVTPSGERIDRGDLAAGIDRVGMAAGLALLVSQAKGDITGLKSEFALDKEEATKMTAGKNIVKVITENEDGNKRETIKVDMKVPVKF
jgi:hypothetical protein